MGLHSKREDGITFTIMACFNRTSTSYASSTVNTVLTSADHNFADFSNTFVLHWAYNLVPSSEAAFIGPSWG